MNKEKNKFIKNCFDLFGLYPIENFEIDDNKENVKYFYVKCLKRGFIPSERLLLYKYKNEVFNFILHYYAFDKDFENTTFYGNFKKVLETNEFELRLHQLLNYLTSYWIPYLTGIEVNVYVPSKNPIKEYIETEIDISILKEVDIIEYNDLKKIVLQKLYDNKPLCSEDLEKLINIVKYLKVDFDINKVQLRELKVLLINEFSNKLQLNEEEFLRYAVYKLCGKTQYFSNSKKFRESLKFYDYNDEDIEVLCNLLKNIKNKEKLLQFYKTKRKLFEIILYKLFNNTKDKEVKNIINYLRDNYKKVKTVYNKLDKLELGGIHPHLILQNFLSFMNKHYRERNRIYNYLKYKFDDIDYKYLLKILNSIRYNLFFEKDKVFYIRNGKYFVKEYENKIYDRNFLEEVYYNVKNMFIDKIDDIIEIKDEDKEVILDERIVNYKLSVSDKKNLYSYLPPEFSYVEIDDKYTNFVVGITWKGKMVDLDLNAVIYDIENNINEFITWDSSFKINMNNEMLFVHTGDMTDGTNGASELILIKQQKEQIENEYIVKLSVNNFRDGNKTEYKNFVLTMLKNIDLDKTDKYKMMNFNNAFLSFPIEFKNDSTYMDLGIIVFDKKLNKKYYVFPISISSIQRVFTRMKYINELLIDVKIKSLIYFTIYEYFNILKELNKINIFEVTNNLNKCNLTMNNWNTILFEEKFLNVKEK